MSDKNQKNYGNKQFGRKTKLGLPFTENIVDKDLINIRRDQTTEGLWIRYEDLKQDIIDGVELPDGIPATPFMIDYDEDIVTLATWSGGNYLKKVSTEANAVSHSGTQKWHLSREDTNNKNLDNPDQSTSLWDFLIDAAEGAKVLIKIFNRGDKSEYIYLEAEGDTFSKQNGSIGSPIYYDLEFEASVLVSNFTTTINNPTVAIIIGRQTDVVRNRTDSFTSLPKQEYVVTLERSEWAALGSGRPSTTLYVVPCDGTPILYIEDNLDVQFGGIISNEDVLSYNTSTSKWENKSLSSLGYLKSKTHVSIDNTDSPYTASINEFISCDASGGAITVNLPTAVGNAGIQISVCKKDSSSFEITVNPNGSETINGDLTKDINFQWSTMVMQSDGSNWIIT